MSKRLTSCEFIEKAKSIHGDRYNYTSIEYINMKTKIVLFCENNHKFLISPDNHLKGKRCPSCSGRNDLVNSLQKFIEKSNNIHNEKYLYHKFIFIDNKTKGIIVCKKHGDFEQTTNSHLSGSGCKKCYHQSLRYDLKYFIEKSNKIHNNFYNYSESIYKGYNNSLIIICPKHGRFSQKTSVHLSGSGCKKCMIDRFRRPYEDFIKFANIIHHSFYKYDKNSYIDMKTPMILHCPIHNQFKIIPDNHLSKKQGCPSCGKNTSNSEIEWLNSLSISLKKRQVVKKINNRLFKLDAFEDEINTIYEFYGDFWHGNPSKYNSDDVNPVNKIKYGDLYKRTIDRERYLKSLGYNVVSIWESEYKNEIENK